MDTIHELDKDNERVMKTPRKNLIAYSREQEELRIRLRTQSYRWQSSRES